MSVRRFYLIGFGLLLAFDTLAQLSFKWAGLHGGEASLDLSWLLRVFAQPWIYGAIVGYVGAFFTWMSLLRHAPVGPAFAASHLEVVSVMLLSVWLFDEPLTATKLVGATAILAGILCLGMAERDTTAGAT